MRIYAGKRIIMTEKSGGGKKGRREEGGEEGKIRGKKGRSKKRLSICVKDGVKDV